jgi:hypothetical protein
MSRSSISADLEHLARQPEAVLAELAWRWALRLSVACLLAFGTVEWLNSMVVSDLHPLAGAAARLLRLGAALICGVVLLVMSISGSARAAMLASFSASDRVHLRPQLALGFLRAVLGLAVLLALIGCWVVARWIADVRGPLPTVHTGAFLLALFLLALLVWWAWWLVFTALNLASVAAAQTNGGIGEASRVAVRSMASASFIVVTTFYGSVHALAFVATAAVLLAFVPPGSAHAAAAATAMWITAVLAYVTFADWLAVMRRGSYAMIVKRFVA